MVTTVEKSQGLAAVTEPEKQTDQDRIMRTCWHCKRKLFMWMKTPFPSCRAILPVACLGSGL